MTLHEAIRDILINYGSLSVKEITDRIYETGIYRRKDGEFVNPVQVNARIQKYPELFEVDEKGNIILKQYALTSLKRSVEKIAGILESSNLNTESLKEVLLPAFAIFLGYTKPDDLLSKLPASNVDLVDVITNQLKWFNSESLFQELFEKPIRIFNTLERSIQAQICYQIVLTYNQFTKIKPVFHSDFFNSETMDFVVDEQMVKDFSTRYQQYQKWSISETDFKVYFDNVINEFIWKRKIKQAKSTPKSIISLIQNLVKIDPSKTVFDPFMGNGSLLCALASDSKNISVIGGDVIENAVVIAKLLFRLYNIENENLFQANALVEWANPSLQFDWVITEPPASTNISVDKTVFSGYGSPKNFTEAAINLGLYHTHADGKVCIVVPESFLYSKNKSSYKIKKGILENNYLDAIISLPAGVYAPFSNFKAAILILDKGRNDRALKDVFFYDGTSINPKEIEKFVPDIRNRYDEFRTQDLYITPNAVDLKVMINADFSFDIADIIHAKENKFSNPDYKTLEDLLVQKPLKHTFKSFSPLSDIRVTESISQSYYYGNSIDQELINTNSGIPYITVNNLREKKAHPYIESSDIKQFVSETKFLKARYIENRALLVSRIGDRLMPVIYIGNGRALFNKNILCLNVDEEKVLADFLVIELDKDYFIEQLNRVVRKGTVLKTIRTEQLLKLKVWVPPIEQQRQIVQESRTDFFRNQINKDELSTVLGALKHNVKGPLGGIRAYLDRLHFYLQEKERNGTTVSLQDLAFQLMPGLENENHTQYNLTESIKRTKYHISRIDNYFKKAIKLLIISDEKVINEQIKLSELIDGYLKTDNNYNLPVINSTNPKFKNVIIQSDRDRLLSVLELFLDNAFVHGFRNHTDVDSRFEISWEVSKDSDGSGKVLSISVANNGLPAPDLTLEKFIKNGYSTNRMEGGSGVGGFYIEKLLHSMGGNLVAVEDLSEKPEINNIRFTFNLPYYG